MAHPSRIKKQRSTPLNLWIKRTLVFLGSLLFLVLCIIGYFEFFYSPEEQPSPVSNATQLAAPVEPLPAVNGTEAAKAEARGKEAAAPEVIRGTVNSGETAKGLLLELLPNEDVHSLISSCNPVYSLNKMRAGQPYTIVHDEQGFSRFEYQVDDEVMLVICKEVNTFNATLEPIVYDVVLEKVTGTIKDSMFATMAELGESPLLAVRLADIFAWEINFIRDIQEGDTFTVLVEKRYRDGEFKGYGKLLAAEFINQGKKFEGFSFADSFGNTAYYNSTGESVKRAFLKAPLSFTRISSRFANKRFHPVLKAWKAHPAVDYAAPTGTPVKAIGNGVVHFSGRGKGAGNYITLKHTGNYESMYLHLSGFAKGLKKGAKVSQGQVIGYVGSTGYSTGPHLDFRMKKGGEFINPEKALSPRSEPVTGKMLARFKEERELFRQYLNGTKSLADYKPGKGIK